MTSETRFNFYRHIVYRINVRLYKINDDLPER